MTARSSRLKHRRTPGRRGRRYALRSAVVALPVCASVAIGAVLLWAVNESAAPLAGSAADSALSAAADRTMVFLDYFVGVFTLLALTAAVVCGLAATDRLVLTPRLRVAVQSVHRATAVAALGFLSTHIAVKVVERHAAPSTAVLPFSGGAAFAVSLGTVAADLLVLVAATGALRGRFAGSRRPWLWRVLHASAYACWPIALAHGLSAGRQAHAWVVWSYGLCAAVVALALLVRALAFAGRSKTRTRHRRGLKAYRPTTPLPAALADLSAPSAGYFGQPPSGLARARGRHGRPVRDSAAVPRPLPVQGGSPGFASTATGVPRQGGRR
ncbi:hypothetical protein [Kitasatospora sp. GP82]|uniref:hypothetical protein n=1 Tax=Kitasatospora sp. GP82 TaxID=3035089 RepID=UPI0024764AF3|nr:hypothetical protein [Kitasatospora sp. GP82]MDH6123745.1 hypothetical protein [Kitasatospora sp. GP82]